MFCKNCGKELEEGWMACPNCGEKTAVFQEKENIADSKEPVRNTLEQKTETDFNLVEKRKRNIRLILKVLALVAMVCLFCPLYMVSCAGREVCSISGLDMTLGFQVMGEDIDGNWLYGIIAILPLFWFLSYCRKPEEKDDTSYVGATSSGSLLFLMIFISTMLENAFESGGMLVITSCTALIILKTVCFLATGMGGYLAFLDEIQQRSKETVHIAWTIAKCAGKIIGSSILIAVLILGVIQYFALDEYEEKIPDEDSYDYLSEMNGKSDTGSKEQITELENTKPDNVELVDPQDSEQEKSKEIEKKEDAETEKAEYIFPNSDSQYLSEDELWEFSAEKLRIGRNEIFARHGYIFKDKELQEYFENMTWYKGVVKSEEFDADTEFNKYEKANIELIRNIEEMY